MNIQNRSLLKHIAVKILVIIFTITLIAPEALAEIKLLYREKNCGLFTEQSLWYDQPCPLDIYADGTTVYILMYSDGEPFIVLDVSDPHNIKKIGEYHKEKDAVWQAMPDSVKGSGIWQVHDMDMGDFESRRLAFIKTTESLQVLDCTDPGNIFSLGCRPGCAIPPGSGSAMVEVKSPYVFISFGSGCRIFKYSALAASEGKAPYEFVADVNPGYSSQYSFDFELSRDKQCLYVAGFFGLDAYTIANINKPAHIFRYENINFPYQAGNKGISVKADKNLLFLGTSRDLRIFDISNPAIPKPLKDDNNKDTLYPTLGPVLDIALYGKYAFLFYGPIEDKQTKPQDVGLEIVDISDPRLPEFADAFILGPAMRYHYNDKQKMALVPEAGLAILGSDTFYILDVSDYIK
jgi:hypothetical protein